MKQRSPSDSFFNQKGALLALMFLWLIPGAAMAAPTNNPAVTGSLSPVKVSDEQSATVFNALVVDDGDNHGLTLSITLAPTSLGSLQIPANSDFTFANGSYTIDYTNQATVQLQLHALTFVPVANSIPVPQSSNVTFTIVTTNISGLTASTQLVLQVDSTNHAPTITPVAITTANINDNQTALPFSTMTISDQDNGGGQLQTVTISMDDTNKGALVVGSSGFTANNNGTYTLTATAASATTAIRALVFDPTANRLPPTQKETNTFTIVVTDTYNPATNASIRVAVTSVDDAPVFAGINTSPQPVQTGGSIHPFGSASIVDPDRDTAQPTNGQSLTLHITLNNSIGYLSASGGNDGTNLLLSGIDATTATAVIQTLRYVAPTFPLANTNNLIVTLTAHDGFVQVGTNVTVSAYTLLSPPGLSGTQSGQHVNDNTTISPFSTVSIQSFNGNSLTVLLNLGGVTNDAQGQLINLNGFVALTNTSPTTYSFTGPSESATAAIRALLFQPTPNRLSGSTNETVLFGITLIDGALTNTDFSTTVIVTPVNDPPTIAGISPLIAIDDTQTAQPFPSVLVSDLDELGQQQLSVGIRLDDNGKGTFTNILSGFATNAVNGGYTLVGSPANVTAIIRQLVFVPTPGRVAVGLTETTILTISANDQHGGTATNSNTSIRVVAVSGKPVIQLPASQPVSIPLASNIFPFQAASIFDATPVTVSVQVPNGGAAGFFTSNSVAAAGFTNNGGGLYTFGGTAASATASIRQLNFQPTPVPPPGTVLNFTITVTDQVPNTTVANLAVTLRQIPRSFIVTKTTDYDPNSTNVSAAAKAGTLRDAVAAAGSNDHITFDIRSSTPGLPDYPATIRLQQPLVLNNNLTFDGPGADQLTISGDTFANGTANVQLFVIKAFVTMNRITFTKGHDSFAGGAFEVSTNGNLKLSYCAVTDSSADVWGGGIDVDLGHLSLDHCLLSGNFTSASLGQGGGAISLFTEQECEIANTTFSSNQQLSPVGLGGGALYVEAADSGLELDVFVLSCTFSNNLDAANHGSSIRPNVSSTFVQLRNTIFADGHGKNLERDQSGIVLSLGGNISDDGTSTIFSAGGEPVNTVILDQPTDRTNTVSVLSALTNHFGPTLTHALGSNSPAINNAVSYGAGPFLDTLGTDQRGYWREGSSDIGAFELGAAKRVIIEEINFAPANTNDEFIEFYVPRDSLGLNLAGYQVYVGGILRHTFTSQNLAPGEALVLFSHDAISNGVPGGVYRQIAATNLLLDDLAGSITLKNPSNQAVLQVSYVGSFASSDTNNSSYLAATNQSIVLSPQFQGVFLPYQRVVQKEGGRIPGATDLSGAGYDVSGKPLAIGNAPPLAYNDGVATLAGTPLAAVPVLGNDFDPDATDVIRVVGVGITNGITPGVTGSTNFSALGALVTINASGASVRYDPTASVFLTSLPAGSNAVDTFQYTILDSSNGVDHARGDLTQTNLNQLAAETNQNIAKATATVTINVTGVNSAPTPQADGTNTNPVLITFENQPLDFTTWDNLLANDTDPNSDDNAGTLKIVSIEPTPAYASTVQITSALGASVTLDIRFDRKQTHLTYNPANSVILRSLAQGQTAIDTFYYSVMDRYGAIGTAAVNITVVGVDNPPVANPNSFATDEDTPLAIPAASLLANDIDPDTGITNPAPPHLVVSLPAPLSLLGASIQVVGTNVLYDPTVSSNLNTLARKEVVVDTFTYIATDDFGASSTATVSVTITGINDHPIGADDAYATGEKILLSVVAPGVLTNDRDPDVNGAVPDDTIQTVPFANLTTAAGATVNMNADGGFSYDPQAFFAWLKQGQTVTDTFVYSVMDHSLTIANDDAFTVQAGSSSIPLPVMANDVILSQTGATLSITSVTAPSNGGTVTINAQSNGLIYTPQLAAGNETFTYTISDGQGGTDTANVTVSVRGNILNPVTDSFIVAKGTTASLDVLANDNILPASGAALSIVSVGTTDKGGTAVVGGPGPNNLIAYTPSSTNTFPFTETFTYVVSAAGTLSATGTVVVTVIDRTNTLTANDDNFTVITGGANNVLNVLANDQILPGPNTNLTIISIQTNSVVGTVSINASKNRLIYRPAASASSGPETIFHYTISDGAGGTATAAVAIQVQSSGFFANDDVFSVAKNSQSNALGVLTNDVILPNLGQNLSITAIGLLNNAPNHGGTVTISGTGKGLVYTPSATNFTGQETFTYEISDGTAARASGHVVVNVINTSVLKSSPDAYLVARESSSNPLAVLKNDYVLPKTPGALTITGLETNGVLGTASISGSGSNNFLIYTPKPGFIGAETFGYEISDGHGNVGTNLVTVTVGGLVTQNDRFSVLSNSATNSLDVLANDLLLPDTLGVRPISGLGLPDQGGIVTTNASATRVLYTPAPGFVGVEHFAYQMKDDSVGVVTGNATVTVVPAGSDRDTRTVTITLVGTNDAPVIAGTQSGLQITDKMTIQPFTNVTIVDVDEHGLQQLTATVSLDAAAKGLLQNLGGFVNFTPGSYTITGIPTNVTAAIRGLVFVPTANRIPVPTTETTTFTISLNDNYVLTPVTDSNTAIAVTAVNDAPTITGTLAGQRVYDRLSLRPFAGVTISDVDNLGLQPLAVTVTLDLPSHGVLNGLGGFTGSTNGVYTIANATAAQVTTALRGMVFVPTTATRLSPGGSEISHFTIAVNDGFAPAVVDSTTTVTATDGFTKKLTTSAGTTSDSFVASVSSALNLLVVGTPFDNGAITHSGSARVYSRTLGGAEAWGQSKKLVGSSSPTTLDQFGFSVGLSGDTAVVGAPGATSNGVAIGVVYIFDRNLGGTDQWNQVIKLLSPDGASGDQFGNAVAINGDTLVVGAHRNHVGAPRVGSAYVFTRNQGGTNHWGFVKKLVAADGADLDDFGFSVAINVDTVVIGSQSSAAAGIRPGSAYVFTRNQGGSNQWGQVKKLAAADPFNGATFGHAVGVSGDLVVVGAPLDTGNGTQCGSMYVYARNQGGANQWGQVNKLIPADGIAFGQFGISVSIDGEVMTVGGTGSVESAPSGSIYVYARTYPGISQWSLLKKYPAPSGDGAIQFGAATSLSQGTLATVAHINDGGGNRSALTYIYRVKFDNAPILAQPVPDQVATTTTPFNLALPAGTFADADINDTFTFSLGSIPVPPAWLSINPLTGALSGTPDAPGVFPITVIATDLDGLSRTGQFTLTVTGPALSNVFSLVSMSLQTTVAGPTPAIQLSGLPGYTYKLQRATNLLGTNTVWSNVASGITDTNGLIMFYDTNAPAPSFYRAIWP
jgi:VCBS repeat-containing protein